MGKIRIKSYLGTICVITAAAIIIIIATHFFTRITKDAAGDTTGNLSQFYLEEIAERTVYEINTVLENNTAQLQRAIDEMSVEQILSVESLREYLALVQQLNGLDIFAVVDETGMVYTSDNTFSGISRFGFLSDPVTETKIFTTRTNQSNAMVLVAMPMDQNIFSDTHIVTCITGVDVDKIISAQQLQGVNNQVLCRLFNGDDGTCIVEPDDKYADGSSIFDVWKKDCMFSKEYPYEKLIKDWNSHEEGYSQYTTKEGETYLYYKPVPGTGWMVSARLREGVISTLVTNANEKILYSSWIQMTVVVISMITVVFVTIRQVRHNQSVQFEREKEEELLRQEAKASEEKLRLQEKLLEEEKASNRQASVLQILSRQYTSVLYADLEESSAIPIRLTGFASNHYKLEINKTLTLKSLFDDYIQDMVSQDEIDKVLQCADTAFLKEALKEEESLIYRYRVRRKDKELYAELQIARVGNKDTFRNAVMGFAIVDEAVRAEQEQQRILKDALNQAESANQAKTIFLNNMSHDIRTLMNAIVGFTNLALKQDVTPEVKEFLEKISESSEHLLTLINDILNISRIESGKVQVKFVPVNIVSVTDSVLNIMHGFLADRNITFLVYRAKPEHPYVLADKVRIREILVNILSNAVKFTGDGGTITFETEFYQAEDETHRWIRYRIKDTGIGMKKEFLEHIFEEFAQEESGARTQYKGTGLGMAITKHYVELMGGTISVESKKGEGSVFTVEIPVELTNEVAVEEHQNALQLSDLKGINILLAEDNELNAEIAQTLLTDEKANVTVVHDGQEAVDVFRTSPAGTFDAILMDIMMPVMDGIDATKMIRAMQRPDAKVIPIIAMTANAFEEDARKCLDAGMSAHLAKPIHIVKIKQALMELLPEKLERKPVL